MKLLVDKRFSLVGLCFAATVGATEIGPSDSKCPMHLLRPPRVRTVDLDDFSNRDSYFQHLRYLHRKLGPVFTYPALKPMARVMMPLAHLGRRLPKRFGGARFEKIGVATKNWFAKVVHVSHPDLFEQVARSRRFRRVYNTTGFQYSFGKYGSILLEDNDPLWRPTHVIMQAYLTKREVRSTMGPVIEAVTRSALARYVDERFDLDVRGFSDFVAMGVAHRIAFGFDLTPEAFAQFHDTALSAWRGVPEKGTLKTKFRRVFDEYLDKIERKVMPGSLGEKLMDAAAKFPDGWWDDQMAQLFFASEETTRALIALSLHELSQEIERQIHFRSENGGRYRESFVKEALRVHPIITLLFRRVVGTTKVGPYEIKGPSMMKLDFGSVHDNPAYYDRPDEFDPTRFMIREENTGLTFCPFGIGARVCVGQHLAVFEAETVLKTVADLYDLAPGNEAFARENLQYGARSVHINYRLRLTPRSNP